MWLTGLFIQKYFPQNENTNLCVLKITFKRASFNYGWEPPLLLTMVSCACYIVGSLSELTHLNSVQKVATNLQDPLIGQCEDETLQKLPLNKWRIDFWNCILGFFFRGGWGGVLPGVEPVSDMLFTSAPYLHTMHSHQGGWHKKIWQYYSRVHIVIMVPSTTLFRV